jgi:hypothetical protein
MILGKITVRVENTGGHRYYFCRPIANGVDAPFDSIIGVCQVVYLEKSIITEALVNNSIITVFGIFNRKITQENWDRSFVDVKVSPITEDIYDELLLIYPQESITENTFHTVGE